MTYTMLIVDDSRVSRLMLRSQLADLRPDWHFLEAANGQEALDHAAQVSIQLVSMDLNMPGMDGIEAARQLHALQSEAKIILLTANVQQSTRERAAGASLYFIPKPINEQTLLQIIAFAEGQ